MHNCIFVTQTSWGVFSAYYLPSVSSFLKKNMQEEKIFYFVGENMLIGKAGGSI